MMIVNRMGTFRLDDENVTGFFVSCTLKDLKKIPFNPLLARVELHPLDVYKKTGKSDVMTGSEEDKIGFSPAKINMVKPKINFKKIKKIMAEEKKLDFSGLSERTRAHR